MPRFARIAADARGIASIELAAVAPVMFMLLLGVFEMANYARAAQKVAAAAQTLADLVAAQKTITNAASGSGSIGDLCLATAAALAPLQSAALTSAVASRTFNGTVTTTDWGVTCPDTAGFNPTDAVPAGMMNAAGDSVIEVQLSFNYSSKIYFFLPTVLTISQTAYARPRINATIPLQ